MDISVERNKFPLQNIDEVTQRYICPDCGWLQSVVNIKAIKIRPENTGTYLVKCPKCNADKEMRIITPTNWVREITNNIVMAEALAGLYTQGAFIGSRSDYNTALANGLILKDTLVILTTNA